MLCPPSLPTHLRPTYLSRGALGYARSVVQLAEKGGEGGGGEKEGNGAIKRQSQASNFQVICFHHAGKMFRFASFCPPLVRAPYFQSRNPVLPAVARGHSKK